MKILLVDDQRVILEGLVGRVNWARLGIEQVLTAESVATAKKIVCENAIDILVTDIEMPVENGMALAAWMVEHYPHIPCIFLTAFADFSYAQKAIKYGGFDYVLQPAKTEEIERVIRNCIEYVQQNRDMQSLVEKGSGYDDMHEKVLKNLVQAMFEKSQNPQVEEEEWKQEIQKKERFQWFLPLIVDSEIERVEEIELLINSYLGDRGQCVGTSLKERSIYRSGAFIICGYKDEEFEDEFVEFFEQLYMDLSKKVAGRVAVYAGKVVEDELLKVIQGIKETQADNVLLKEGVFYQRERRYTLKLREPKIEDWKQWMLGGDGRLIQNQIRNLLDYAENEGQLTREYMKSLFELFTDVWIVCCYLKKINGKDFFEDSGSYEEFRHAYQTMETFNHAVEFIIDKFNEVVVSESKNQENLTIPERIQIVKQYIEENIDKNITRADAAAMSYLSEDYFTKLFKAETGYGFKEYILSQKIEYCKRLLRETNYPVGIIAGKVGYDNFSNFTQIFKKITGTTPQEFRKEQ